MACGRQFPLICLAGQGNPAQLDAHQRNHQGNLAARQRAQSPGSSSRCRSICPVEHWWGNYFESVQGLKVLAWRKSFPFRVATIRSFRTAIASIKLSHNDCGRRLTSGECFSRPQVRDVSASHTITSPSKDRKKSSSRELI